jgi:anaerobic ribonucleoside-triphosphate reductase activating protein
LTEKLRIYGTADDSIVDGPGIRFAVFAQGCHHHCPGCHNPGSQPFAGGREVDVAELQQMIAANPLLAGITLTGGEPFEQPGPLLELAVWAHGRGLNVWAYSGYLYEQLAAGEPSPLAAELLAQCDVLVDGPFVESQASYESRWRGSTNQRIIDIPASLQAGAAVLLDYA